MAIVELAGESVGSATCLGSLVLIVPAAGESVGKATCSAGLVLVARASGSAVAAATCSGSLVLIKTVGGAAEGKATTSLGPVRLFAILAGSSYGSASGEAFVADRDVYAAIRSNLPDLLQQSVLIKSLQQAQGVESVRLLALVQQLLQDYFVDTASEASLGIREAELQLRVKPEYTLQQRRQRIKQRLRGPGILTKQRYADDLRDNYYACKVEEWPADYRVKATILSIRGVPEEYNELVDFADSLLPSHLVNEIEPTYLPWDEIDEVNLTWDQAEQIPSWDQLETTFLIPVEEVLRRNGVI